MSGLLITSLFKKVSPWTSYLSRRLESQDLRYDLSEDIITTTYKKVLILGINLPDVSNALDDSALCKLNQKLKDFNTSDKFTVAVLHGLGGNFCTGIQETASKEKANEIIKTMKDLRKPTIATLTGFTTFFGFQLALMCDLRIMEVGSICGFGHRKEKCEVDVDVCQRLLALTNVSATLDFVLGGGALDNNTALSYGLINRCVEIGTALAKSITLASAIAKFPHEEVISHRKLIYSLMEKK